ncbi:aldose 1-epimerase family protein [Botryobacter ruber]|uniref:aldose 1-epimerase family protein n=1 Tax=Botryobacter ruber TaxID=2171629 RepID=UPI000E0B8CFA|nr:aldose 1-epimerase family protein [Botryobacter ruber]
MLHFIQNDFLKIGVDTKGAELQHLILKLDAQLELLWQGDPAIWAGQAPNLFPIIGELPDGQYTYEGQSYQMKRHGFARLHEFRLVEEHHDKLVLELKYNDDILAQYPFRFRLLVAYKLIDNRLEVSYLVNSEDDKAIYFSVGAHPGFNVPLYAGEQYSDYYIEFEQEETARRYLLNEKGLLSGETEPLLEQERILPLRHSYFDKDAIVLKNLKSEKLVLASKTNSIRLEIAYPGFPYLGIWAKPGPSPYVCIEPWCGIASRAGDTGALEEKEGINSLGPKQAFERTFSITVK